MGRVLLPLFAVVAGAISFTSPCCLPLLPGYVSYISGLPVSELGATRTRSVTLRAALAFVAGFTVIFTVLGVASGLAGAVVLRALPVVVRVAGVGIVVLGLAMAGVLKIPLLYRERRFGMQRVGAGPKAAFGVGAAFAAGWTPCLGPVLATILTAAAATRTAAWGGLLLALYSVGLGLPFIALAMGLGRWRGSTAWLRDHGRAIEIAGGLLLVGVGVLFVSGAWRSFFLPLQREFARLGWPPL